MCSRNTTGEVRGIVDAAASVVTSNLRIGAQRAGSHDSTVRRATAMIKTAAAFTPIRNRTARASSH